jgi:3',5'-cyclic-AMP phosphodiesterase
VLLAQLSDPHITAPGTQLYNRVDTARHLREAVATLMALNPRPDVVVLSGDLVDRGSTSEYSHLRELLQPISEAGIPLYVIPGNHDHRENLQAAFADQTWMPQAPDFIQYVVEDFPVRLIALDTWVPKKPYGELCDLRLAWLERALADGSGKPTIVMLHHPPFCTFIEGMDGMGLRKPDRLAAIVQRHPEIERVLCGHLHRSIQVRFAGTLAQTAPSTAHQLTLNLAAGVGDTYIMEPPGFLLHRWSAETGVVTHTVTVGGFPGPYPFSNA